MMEVDNMREDQTLDAAGSGLEESVAEGSNRRSSPVNDLQVSGDVITKRVRRSGLRQPKAAPIVTAPATVPRNGKRAKTSASSTLANSTSIPSTPTASTSTEATRAPSTSTASTLAPSASPASNSIASSSTASTSTASTSTASTSTASTSIASTSTTSISMASTSTASTSIASTSTAPPSAAAVTPRAPTKRKKSERPAASHPYVVDPAVSIGERGKTSAAPQRLGSPSSASVPHSGNENRPNSRVRRQGHAQRRVNSAEHVVHPVSPDGARNSGEEQSEEDAVHALMHMQHDRYQRARAESYSPPQDAGQPYPHQYHHPYQHEHHYQYAQNQDMIQNHTPYYSPPHHASNRQDHEPDHFTNSYRYYGCQQTPQDHPLQAREYAYHHHDTGEAFSDSHFRSIHDHDMYATYQEPPAPETRGYQSHHQHPGSANPQHFVHHHVQSLAPTETHFQHGHYPTRPLSIPPQVIDCTLRLHQAFYDWGFAEGFTGVFHQTHHGYDQRQAEYQQRWGMYERGLQVGIAIAQEQQQQHQQQGGDPTQMQPAQYTTPALSSPQAQPTQEDVTPMEDVAPMILPALPAGGPLPRVPLGQFTLPALQLQGNLPESLDRDWCVLPKISAFPPASPPPRDAAGTESHREQAGRAMLAAEPSSTSTSTPSMLDLSSAAASSASTASSPPSAPETPRRNDDFYNRQQA
ncbi:hypothetical protein BGZ75_006483 [Mortierella antarctica]|nr:hypothetical protein BGZ75_006483 [Mortierella antarctica]